MIKFKRLYVIIFFVLFIGIVACQTKPVTDVVEVTEKTEHKDKSIANGVNDAGSDDEHIVKIVSGNDSDKSIVESQMNASVISTDEEPDSAIGIEYRLLICPEDEDIPESIKLVFTDYAPFNLVFDLGYEVYSRESGSSVELYTEYLSAAEHPSGIGSITTNVEEYDCGGPYYSEGWRFPLYWYAYKVMDMDNDGVNELIYRVSPGDSIESWDDYYLIFHEIDGRVYAFATSLYCAPLTEDGLMTIGHGSKDILYKICSFDTERYYIDCLAYYSSIDDSDNPVMVLGDKYVSGEEWIEFYKENYDDKEKAVFKSKDGLVIIR